MREHILSLFALAAACGNETADRHAAPVHVVVICADLCDPAARSARFRTWADRAIDHAGSRFEVWHTDGSRAFSAEVPSRWPAPVTASRADFIARGEVQVGREDASASDTRGAAADVEGDVEVVVLGAPDLERSVLAGLAAAAPAHAVVVCDRSSSTLGVSCQPSTVRRAAIEWLAHGGVLDGASFEVLVPGNSYDSAHRLAVHHTTGQEVGERIARALHAVDALADTIAGERGSGGSAIAETIRIAVEHLGEVRGRRSLLVLSDLRQVTPGRWNFERRVPSALVFAKWLDRAGLTVNLRGLDVDVCGTHHMRGNGAGSFDARMAHDVVELWSSILHAAGCDARIQSDCDTSPADVASR
jgi:hypothetical protein